MKKILAFLKKLWDDPEEKRGDEARSLKNGSYSVSLTLIVIAIAIAVNLLVSSLPSSWTKADVTSNQLYSVSYQTKKILKGLDDDVTIYWVSQKKEENETLSLLLSRYDSLTDKVTVVEKDPDIYPNFSEQYGADSTENNSLVVESGSKYRYISYSDIFGDSDSSSSSSTSFAGESMITSAISYVTADELPKIYMLQGHGESTFSDDLADAVEKDNIETEDLSLLTSESVPEDADIVMLYSPQSDISEVEKEALEDFAANGGSIVLVSDLPEEDTDFTNLYALMEEYGMKLNDGVVIEADTNHYAWSRPYYLLADIQSHEITDPLIEDNYYIMTVVAQGITIEETTDSTLTVTSLLNTSDSAFSKLAGYDLTTYEEEDGDIDGPFSLAAIAEKDVGAETTSKALWITSSSMLDDTINSYVSGGDQNFLLNALAYMTEREDNISIRTKTTTYSYLTMDSTTSQTYSIIIIAIIPIALILIGAVILIRRRRR